MWLWAISGARAIGREAREAMDRAAEKDELLVPIIAVWEVGMLDSKHRIEILRPVEDWVADALALPGYQLAPLTPDIALLCHRLPGELHGDAADRMIVATTMALDATLVTRDKRLLAYGALGHVKVLAA